MNKRLPVLIVVLIAMGAMLVGCGSPQDAKTSESASRVAFTMGTVARLSAHGPDAEEALEKVVQELDRLTGVVDRFTAESDIARLNAAGGDWVTVGAESLGLVRAALEWADTTGGAFDPTIAPLIDLWGFIEDKGAVGDETNSPTVMQGQKPPAQEAILRTLALVDHTQVAVDVDGSRLKLAAADTRLDLGGIAKGYGADRAATILREQGITSALIDLGGDMYALGKKTDGSLWRIGVINPRDPSQIFAVIPVSDQAVVTSGDYERYFEYEGVRYTHLIDPQTGYPQRGLASVTVVAPSGTAADALATAVSVLGMSKGIALLERLPGVDGILIDTDLNVQVTSGIREQVQF